jgi:hypothetical protein
LACTSARDRAGGSPSDPVPLVGEAPTVGNKPDGFMGETPVPAMVGRVPGTGTVACGPVPVPAPAVPLAGLVLTCTRSVADAANEVAPGADAFAVTRTCSPLLAFACTGTVTSSSSASPMGSAPMAHLTPPVTGQTANLGAPRCRADATVVRTETLAAAAFVLHTQTTNEAACPAVTLAVADSGWTRTQSLAVGGGGVVGETLGVGLGDVLRLELGVGLGALVLADGDGLPEPLDRLLVPGDGEGDVVGLGGGLLEVDALALASACPAAAFVSTVVLGSVAHTDLAVGAIATTAASACVMASPTGPNPRKITAPSAPSAPGLMISPVT